MDKKRDLVRVTIAAKILGVDRKTVREWIDKRILRAYRVGKGCMWLIDRDDLDKLLVPNIPPESEGSSNNEGNPPESRETNHPA